MRKLFCFTTACSAAMLAAVSLLPSGLLLPLAALCAALGGAAFALHGRSGLRVRLVCFGLAVGLAWTALYQSRTLMPAQMLDGVERPIEAVIGDWPSETRYGWSAEAALHTEQGAGLRIRLYGDEAPADLRPGDRIRGTAVLSRTDAPGNEAEGIFLTGTLRDGWTAERPERVPLRLLPAMWSRVLKDGIGRAFPEDLSGFFTALVTGDKSGLDEGTYGALKRAGAAHIAAVSGLHVSFLAGLAVRLLGTGRKRTALGTILLMGAFAGIAGFTPSVLRAVSLQTMLLLAPLCERENDGPTSLSLALMLILLNGPYAGLGIGLQLSFASVAGIYALSGRLYENWTWWIPRKPKGLRRTGCRAFRFLAASLATTLGAMVFTVPLTAWYFGTLSLIGPVTDLLILGPVSAAFALALLAGALGLAVPALGCLLAFPAALLAQYVLWVTEELSRLPLASVPLESVYLRGWLGLVYVLLILLFFLRKGEHVHIRPVLPLCAGTVGLCAALVCTAAEFRGDRLTVSVLDVGQGQSVAFLSQGRTALVDCGGSDGTAAGDTAADFFRSAGIGTLDVLILTHYHADHAGGVAELLRRMEVGTLIVPDVEEGDALRREILSLAEEKGTEVCLLSEDASFRLGGAEFRIVRPLGAGTANEEGLSVLCSAEGFDALLTGDMDDAVERRLVKYGALPQVDLLVAGHHGSRYATSWDLLEAVEPDYLAVSVGENAYGQPAPETLARAAGAGCAVYRTDWQGRIDFHVK
ncbi:ComEC/Rec2 family competence protein [Pseudoflavonifractor sp. MSJ-37]|uniref:ComEC/Rec2 family competence protein n=1 Tax=Pseudoflavonifractor sp. MSJ-37 TaxID=2841531 RepID=UPI001C10CB85|nr:ComEC/Rec2 family competence protein [Pseudoflavonifractor sp. MSJ-37]MBU5435708.1 ComEC/Rec2 family competence protein [Pseudoflavonifractor sp. MSJ-37]